MSKYYVQLIAENYLKNLSSETLNVHDKFLHGLSRDEFADGFDSLRSLVRQIYSDIAESPADFGMMLKEIERTNAKNTDYTNSNASFLRVPNLLLALGAISIIGSDGVMTIDHGKFSECAKTLKITGLPLLLTKLRDYGFDISDFGKAPKAGETLSITYIDNRYLTTALKSMADAVQEMNKGDLRNPKNNDYYYILHPALLENETVKIPKLSIDTIYTALDPVQRNYAATFHKIVEDSTKYSVRISNLMRNDWTCIYTGKKSKRVLMSLLIKQGKLSIKLNLQNINTYISLVTEMPEKIQTAITEKGWECGQCNPKCSGGFTFEMNGKAYNKCHCGSFVFKELTDIDIPFYKKLISKELSLV